jgi:hypothetical protein
VPSPATGKTALRIGFMMSRTLSRYCRSLDVSWLL